MKVAFVVASHFTDAVWTEPRSCKQATALLKAGHDVVVLGTGKYGQSPPMQEFKYGLQIIRRPTLLHRMYNWIKPAAQSAAKGSGQRRAYYVKNDGHSLKAKLVAHFMQFMYDFNNLMYCLAILPQAVQQKADVYVGVGLPGLCAAYLASRINRRSRLVYDSLELWIDRVREVPYGRLHRAIIWWVERALCRCCDLVVTVSDSVADQLAQRYGIQHPLTILNVPPCEEVEPCMRVRTQLGGGDHTRRIVIYLGYLAHGKGLEQLIEAVQYCDDNIMVSVVGDGVIRPALETMAKQKKVEDRVHFVGWVLPQQVGTYAASADLGASPNQGRWPNNYHTLDNKIFQYVMAGIPIVLSDHPGKRQLVERYGIGATFDETDPRDIARTINGLLSDPERYEAMRARCRTAAREDLNWEVVSRRFVEAIEQLSAKSADGKRISGETTRSTL